MGLLDILRSGIKIADKVTKDLQATVTYQRAVAPTDGYGTFTYPTSVSLRAIVDYRARPVRGNDGVMTVTHATIDLLDVEALAAATADEGVGPHDKFILPDGSTGPVLDVAGFVDRGTGKPIATTVMLG